jgi:DNA polymerase-3 subunit epsilon
MRASSSSEVSRALTEPTFDQLPLPLRQGTFVVVDLETTGTSPSAGAMITEIGAVKIRGGEVLGEFHTLVNPGSPIPPFITVLTGITDAMVAPAPLFHEVLPAFLEFCGPADETILIAHNAPFDIGFLKAAADSNGYSWPNFRVLDTVKIARRTLAKDETPNVKLGTLAQYFGLQEEPTHRALDDARATVHIFHHLLERLGNLGVDTLEALQDFSHPLTLKERSKRNLADGLPNVCGVYIFRDGEDKPLYIGISKNIRKRVLTYFSASETRSRMREMISLAVRIEALPTPTLIDAQIRELRMIQAHAPRYNRRSKFQERTLWLSLTQERFPRLAITKGHEQLSSDSEVIGPFGGRNEAELAREALHHATSIRQCTPRITPSTIKKSSACILYDLKKCAAPCIGAVSDLQYSETSNKVSGNLTLQAGEVVTHHFEKISLLAREERFEEAAHFRNQLTAYLRGFARSENLKVFSSLEELIIAKFINDDDVIEIAEIRRGRLHRSVTIKDRNKIPEVLAALKSQEVFSADSEAFFPDSTPEEVEMLMRWASDHCAQPLHVKGSWHLPTFGANFHQNKVANLAKPDENAQSIYLKDR